MRSYTPGGRFDADFESDDISAGITADRTNPVGAIAQWWSFNTSFVTDPIYDVEPIGVGRVWTGPKYVPVTATSIGQGASVLNERGFYNVDTLHLTFNIDDAFVVAPELFDDKGLVKSSIDLVDKYRIVFKNEVYRPNKAQPAGLVANRHTMLVIDCTQLAPDELVNDVQFLAYAQP
jgi:hypothetical protein